MQPVHTDNNNSSLDMESLEEMLRKLSELEQRVLEAEGRADEAEDKPHLQHNTTEYPAKTPGHILSASRVYSDTFKKLPCPENISEHPGHIQDHPEDSADFQQTCPALLEYRNPQKTSMSSDHR
ncbi:hypothetical protein EAI_10692 [Harpegnathos saltator]|uniref:Uncharacterized protein n=1 Tax=Harpegnathos saltator TaxID=610380 RepID=E2BW90_HARSA|nr:hypothetical protein EAI_10692 [Harpegnathos saltator]